LVIAPGHGWWRWTGSSPDGAITEEQTTETALLPMTFADDTIDDPEPVIRPDKEIGTGREGVYLYFNPNDRPSQNSNSRCLGVQDWSHWQPRCNPANPGSGD
jgi:hypothetical protein